MSVLDSTARVAAVRQAVTSASSCSPKTVAELAELFDEAPGEGKLALKATSRSAVHNPPSKPSKIIANAPLPRARQAKATATVAVVEVFEDKTQCLSQRERFRLATEVVNAALKSLTDAIKAKAAPRPMGKRRSLCRTPSGLSEPSTPLRSRCVNSQIRNAEIPTRKTPSRHSSTLSLREQDQGVIAVAACARAAFAYLRRVSLAADSSISIPPLQLETGMTALIGKMISLDLDDLAVKELRILVKRLDVISPIQGTKTSKASSSIPKQQVLSDLLVFECLNSPESIETARLELIATSQLHLLKLMALRKRPATIEAALDHLNTLAASSPTQLLRRLALRDAKSAPKYIRQLETMAILLQSFCPGLHPEADDLATDPKRCISPKTTLDYQVLVLSIRSTSWELASHEVNVAEDILLPFARCLKCFRRRVSLSAAKEYHYIKDTCVKVFNLHHLLPKIDSDIIPTSSPVNLAGLLEIYNILSDSAAKASEIESALTYAERCVGLTNDSSNTGSSRSLALCKACHFALQLLEARNYQNAETIPIRGLIDAMGGELSGESRELDDLLVALVRLRKPVLVTMVTLSSLRDTSLSRNKRELVQDCLDYLLAVLTFFIRYVGVALRGEIDSRQYTRYLERLHLLRKFEKPLLEVIVTLCRSDPISSLDSEKLSTIDKGLRTYARQRKEFDSQDMLEDQSAASPAPLDFDWRFLISQAHWNYYMSARRRLNSAMTTFPALESSIDLIRSMSERENVYDILSFRLYVLGDSYAACGKSAEAMSAWRESLDFRIKAGGLSNAILLARSLPPGRILDQDPTFSRISQCLQSIADGFVQGSGQLYDDERHSFDERRLLIELQLDFLASKGGLQSTSAKTDLKLDTIARTWLSLCDKAEFPLRRLRAVCRLLSLTSTNPTIINDDIKATLLGECTDIPESLVADQELNSFASHLQASCQAAQALIVKGTSAVSLLSSAIRTWKTIVEVSADYEKLETRIDDFPIWMKRLDILAKYCGIQGLEYEHVTALGIMAAVQDRLTFSDADHAVVTLADHSLRSLSLGHSGVAGLSLQRAKKFVNNLELPIFAKLHWHLAYAMYSLEIGDIPHSQNHIVEAKLLLANRNEMGGSKASTGQERGKAVSYMAMLAYVQALFAQAQGHYVEALFFARVSVKLTHRAWALMENSMKSNKPRVKGEEITKVETLVMDMNTLSLQETRSHTTTSKYGSLSSAPFWEFVPPLVQSLLLVSSLSADGGSAVEASTYLDQAIAIAVAVDSPRLQSQCYAAAGQLAIKRGQTALGLESLKKAQVNTNTTEQTLLQVDITEARFKAKVAVGEHDDAFRYLRGIEASLDSIGVQDLQIKLGSKVTDVIQDLTNQSDSLAMEKLKSRVKPTLTKSQTTLRWTTKATKATQLQRAAQETLGLVPVSKAQGRLQRQFARLALIRKDFEAAKVHLNKAAEYPQTLKDIFLQALGLAEVHITKSIEMMATDSVYCVLHESTTSFPAVMVDKPQPVNSADTAVSISRSSKPVTASAKKGGRGIKKKSLTGHTGFVHELQQALSQLKGILLSTTSGISTNVLHSLSHHLAKAILTASATSITGSSSGSPSYAAFSNELGRSLAFLRQQATKRVEQALLTYQNPGNAASSDDLDLVELPPVGPIRFQADYINIIPASWEVVTISLSLDRTELRLCKLRPCQSPFILSIPLNRDSSRDVDDEQFGFDDAKSELHDIITQANKSTHSARDYSQKGATKEWWDSRHSLDARLHDLLVNMENIWLGGFRGVFSSDCESIPLRARFEQSLYRILGKHVPSRRQIGRAKVEGRITLDPRVLDLFIALGNPDGQNDLDEPILDLLYFVIDILQFHGERNAYDEIDFDSIVVETVDALRQYHEAFLQESHETRISHRILILDKATHVFPWESLPCLKGQAISRLPSLICLRDRILQIHKQQDEIGLDITNPVDGLSIDSRSTSYILNPSTDLAHTESTFEQPLSSLQTHSHTTQIVSRAPTSEEFESILSSDSLLLYFGHGSGGQYIRSRDIRKLDKCAVALLMGCSSAKLVEEGEYEPHGMVYQYLLAGSPAVVGTLWDVTDKDIDRWSEECLKQWGLFPSDDMEKQRGEESPCKGGRKAKGKVTGVSVPKTPGKGRGKAKVVEDAKADQKIEDYDRKGKVSLDQAVARGREKCFLKYLNGAAPVVYGIPVYLH
ncbi:hypothetical protein MMC25_001490 [Agyrium rufum]|nr:hypothetical protein [Agyrium rufum]